MKKLTFTLLILIFSISVFSQNYRYTDKIFETVTITSDVVFTNAPELNAGAYSLYHDESSTTDVDLVMDIHQPTGDSFTNRPAIIFVHGGAFISGNKDHDDMKAFCDTFALKGYVTATIEYRLGMYPTDSKSCTRAVYRGLQDGRAAVRFLRANAATYGIDPTRIYMAGSSAGGFVALQNIYMDDASEKPGDAGSYSYTDPTNPVNTITAPDLGDYDIGNDLSENGTPEAIMSLWGAIQHSDLITADDNTPVFLVHGEADAIVPFGIGSPFSVPTFPATYGSDEINNKLNTLSFTDKETYFVSGQGHEFYGVDNGMWSNGTNGNEYWDTIVNKTVNFFYIQHKPEADFTHSKNNLEVTFTNTSTGANSWNWSFGDSNTSTDENPVHTYTSAGTYRVSLYIENSIQSWDTISYDITVSTEPLYTITFNVSNGTSAISGANISVNSQNLTTDANGEATIDLEDGSYPYTITASGYNEESGTVVVDGAIQTVNVTMTETTTPDYTITFNVTDGSTAISDASIAINSQNLTTDGSGVATLDLEDGSYPYTVSASGYDDETGTVVVNGEAQTIDIAMTLTTGYNELVNNYFKIYPNPAIDIVIIEFQNQTDCYKLEIIDISGRIVLSKTEIQAKTEVNVSNFHKGIYLFRLNTNDQIYSRKILIQ